MHAPAVLQKVATVAIGCLAFELSKLKFIYLMGFLKEANKMHNR